MNNLGVIFSCVGMLMIYFGSLHTNNQLKQDLENLKKENKQLKENLAKASGLPMKSNYKADIEFLDYIIAFKVENIKIYNLQPLQLAQVSIIGDKEFTTWKEEVIFEVYGTLSPAYLRLLQGYFTEESLIIYITEQVSAKLTSEILSANFVIK